MAFSESDSYRGVCDCTVQGKPSYLEHLGKYVLLHGGIVYPDGSSADLDTIQDEVVVLSPDLNTYGKINISGFRNNLAVTDLIDATSVHGLDVLPHGSCEWMVGTAPSPTSEEIFVRIRSSEQGKFRYPQKLWGRRNIIAYNSLLRHEARWPTVIPSVCAISANCVRIRPSAVDPP